MRTASKKYRIRSKIWIEDARGKLVLGPGRLRIFDSIQRTGSIHAAAKELGIGYRAIWGKIKATEQRLYPEIVMQSRVLISKSRSTVRSSNL
jgi:molybdate transport system regulatory protein